MKKQIIAGCAVLGLLTGCELASAISPTAGGYIETARRYIINLIDDPLVVATNMQELARYCVDNPAEKRKQIRAMYTTAKGPVIQVNCENF